MKYVSKLLYKNGYEVINIDSIIMAEEPKMAPYIDEMKLNISRVLAIGENQISIKATTTEGLGAVGGGLGIAAQAVVLLDRI